MLRLALLPFCLFLLMLHATAQQQKPDVRWTAGISLGILPVPGSGPGIQPSLEYYFTRRLSLMTDITLQTDKKNNDDSLAFDKKYFRIRPELRYILSDPERVARFYVGLQGGFAGRRFTTLKNGYYYADANPDSVWLFDRGRINSPINTVSLQMGLLIVNKIPLSLDFFFGIGARFIHTEFSDLVNLREVKKTISYTFLPVKRAYNQLGSITRNHYTLGLRLIWRFGPSVPQKHK